MGNNTWPSITKLKRDIIWYLSANIFYKFVGYIVIVILARYLGKDTLGKYFFALSFVGLFVILSEWGINPLLTRVISRDRSDTYNYMSHIMGLRIILCVICFLIINILAFILQKQILGIILLTSIFMLIESLYSSMGALFLAYKKVKYNIISGVSTKILFVFLIIGVLYYKPDLINILWVHVIASLFMFLLGFFITRTKITRIKPAFDFEIYRQILKHSFPFALLTIIGIIFYRADSIMLGFMKDYTAVGIYGAGYKLREAISFIPGSIAMILYPRMAELYKKPTELKKIYSKAIKWIILPGLVTTVGVFPLARQIILTIYGPQFINSVQVLRILYLTLPFMFVNVITVSLFKAINRENVLVVIAIGCFLLKIFLNFYFIPIYDYLGVAINTIIIDVAQFGIFSYYIHKLIR